MRRTVTTAALLAVVAAGIGLLAALLMPAPASALQTPADPAPRVSAPADAPQAADGFLTALLGDTEVDPAVAAELSLAADRVCEGVTAGVDRATMATTLSAELSLTPAEAHWLVSTAETTRCAAH
jgi:hypothetical protein